MTALLQNFSITLRVVASEKVSFSDIYNIVRLFLNTLTVHDKPYLLNRDNLTQPIQMQLYQKQKTFSEFFSCISKIYIKF